MIPKCFFSGLLIPALFLWFSCAGSPAEFFLDTAPDDSGESSDWFPLWDEYPPPPGMTFIPAEFPSLDIPPGVGAITAGDRTVTLNEGERDVLSRSFRSAYINNLFREAPLTGVLGGDFVHGWPAANPSAWVQNWRSSSQEANSWGIPALILAVRGFQDKRETGRVFIVQGKLLDHYGKSGGINGANGVMGYGAPRGYEFLHEGKLAQRFDFGLITVDQEGHGTFFPESPPSLGLDVPPDIGVFAGALRDLRPAFITAWKMALDRGIGTMIPDGPGRRLSFLESSRDFPGGETLRGLYVQTFNEQSILLVLPCSPVLPPYPRFIASPFLEALLSASRLPGGENLVPSDSNVSGEDAFFRALLRGLALYGIPLTDPMPVPGEVAPWREAQRFSRGWLARP